MPNDNNRKKKIHLRGSLTEIEQEIEVVQGQLTAERQEITKLLGSTDPRRE